MGHILVNTLVITIEHVYVFPYIICMLYYFMQYCFVNEVYRSRLFFVYHLWIIDWKSKYLHRANPSPFMPCCQTHCFFIFMNYLNTVLVFDLFLTIYTLDQIKMTSQNKLKLQPGSKSSAASLFLDQRFQAIETAQCTGHWRGVAPEGCILS